MAGLVPAIHAFFLDVDPRDKPGGDELEEILQSTRMGYRLLQAGTG